MEYSLKYLNKIANLNNLNLKNFIEELNLIGLEIDEIVIEKAPNKISLNDIKLILKIPANRDDLLNETILIQELSTIFLFRVYEVWQKLKDSYYFILKQKYSDYSNYGIIPINSTLNYFLTYAVKIENYQNNLIPKWVKNKLGISEEKNFQLIETLIDLVILEWGQNFNLISDQNHIDFKIERLKEKEVFYLNNENYLLESGTIVLKNQENTILSVLGILNHSLDSKNLILEASFYDISRNSLGLSDLNSQISFRFLRRSFLTNFKFAFQRLLTLIEIIANGNINKNIYKNDIKNNEIISYRILKFERSSFQKVLNLKEYDLKLFEKMSLKIICQTPNKIYLKVPDFRKDLVREIDLIEEYTRFIGYKNFKEIFPKNIKVQTLKIANKNKFIKQFFINYNFNEIFSNSLISETNLNSDSILIKNPLNNEVSILRSSLIPNLIEIFLRNLRFGSEFLKFFEIGRNYRKENNKFLEQESLSLIFSIPEKKNNLDGKLDWLIAKGFIENFLSYFSEKNFTFKIFEDTTNSYYHPKKFLQINDTNKIVGLFGEIHPNYKKIYNLKQNVYLFEFNLDSIEIKNLTSSIKLYKEYSKYPSINKDLSILISKTTNFYMLKNFIKNETKNLKNVNFFDIYFDKNLKTKISLGIRLEFQSFTKTLLNEEIELEVKRLVSLLNKNFESELKI